jgi:formate dehydrogenase major subunit
LKDGVAFEFLSIPLRLLGKEGEVSGIECVKVRLGEPDESGRKRPMPIPGSEFTLDADSVIVAIRQKPDLSFFKSDGLLTGVDGLLEVNPEMLMTDISGVFAGGDVVSGPSCILEAMAYGRKASESIHCFLSGKKYVPHEVCAGVSELSDETAERVKRIKRVSREPSSFSDGDAVNEALRCLGCGFGATVDPERCVACLECVRVCPYNVPKIVDGKAVIDLNECQSCGFCFAECPASAISMSDGLSEYFEERVLSLRKESSKTKKLLVICCSRVLEMLPEVKNPAYISRLVVDCVGRLPSERILKLFNEGFSSVIFVSCDEGMCTHRRGNKISEKRIKRLANILKEVSLGEKLRFSEISNLLEYS